MYQKLIKGLSSLINNENGGIYIFLFSVMLLKIYYIFIILNYILIKKIILIGPVRCELREKGSERGERGVGPTIICGSHYLGSGMLSVFFIM